MMLSIIATLNLTVMQYYVPPPQKKIGAHYSQLFLLPIILKIILQRPIYTPLGSYYGVYFALGKKV